MDCHKIRNLIPLYSGGELRERKARIVSRHLKECQPCRSELRAFQEDQVVLKSLGAKKMPEEFWTTYSRELQTKLRGERSVQHKEPRWSPLSLLLGLRGAPVTVPVAIIALLLGFYLGSLNRTNSPSTPNRESTQGEETMVSPEGSEAIPIQYPVRNISPDSRRHFLRDLNKTEREKERKRKEREKNRQRKEGF